MGGGRLSRLHSPLAGGRLGRQGWKRMDESHSCWVPRPRGPPSARGCRSDVGPPRLPRPVRPGPRQLPADSPSRPRTEGRHRPADDGFLAADGSPTDSAWAVAEVASSRRATRTSGPQEDLGRLPGFLVAGATPRSSPATGWSTTESAASLISLFLTRIGKLGRSAPGNPPKGPVKFWLSRDLPPQGQEVGPASRKPGSRLLLGLVRADRPP